MHSALQHYVQRLMPNTPVAPENTTNEPENQTPITVLCKIHSVLTNATSSKIAQWMWEPVTFKSQRILLSKTVKDFLKYFRGLASANYMTVQRFWNNLDEYAKEKDGIKHR